MNLKTFDFKEFIESVERDDRNELFFSIEKEATVTERFLYRQKLMDQDENNPAKMYAATLKNLIFYLRYRVKPSGVCEDDFRLFQELSKDDHFGHS